jgi:hypothetical protein
LEEEKEHLRERNRGVWKWMHLRIRKGKGMYLRIKKSGKKRKGGVLMIRKKGKRRMKWKHLRKRKRGVERGNGSPEDKEVGEMRRNR